MRGFCITLRAVVDLEWRCAVHDKGCRNTRVARTFMNPLPLDFCGGRCLLNDFAGIRSKHIPITILAFDASNNVLPWDTCL
jgi:hypothetical protein